MKTKKVGVLRFLGTNCDRDVFNAVESVGLKAEWLWHADQFDPKQYSALVLPGGFSFGDYLRCGALAARSAVMNSVRAANQLGTPILGICNGFQILCEAQLLPGVLLKNDHGHFNDHWVDLKLKSKGSQFLPLDLETTLKLPVAHGDGRFFLPDEEVKGLWQNDQVWLTYEKNPNGSIDSIAGVLNKNKNIAGLMPHPERAMAQWMGGRDGLPFFKSILESV